MNRWTYFRLGLVRPDAATAVSVLVLVCLWGWAPAASAYPQYSQNGGDRTNCGDCHGDFRSRVYLSNTDGMNWGDLHDLHRETMLDGDCDTCHSSSGRFPVILNSSQGGDGLDPLACMGCHGRAEDNVPENPEVADGGSGYGAGLRQHHFTAGVSICTDCHLDADPANYTPVGEDVLPPYYANPGSGHPLMPTDPCNPDGNEDFAGIAEGLDNNGDNVYDGDDPHCAGSSGVETPAVAASFQLSNYPNPFSNMTAIEFEVPVTTSVQLRILDVHGRRIRDLDVGTAVSGRQRVEWDGRDDTGREVPSGIYLYEVRAGSEHSQQTMILLR